MGVHQCPFTATRGGLAWTCSHALPQDHRQAAGFPDGVRTRRQHVSARRARTGPPHFGHASTQLACAQASAKPEFLHAFLRVTQHARVRPARCTACSTPSGACVRPARRTRPASRTPIGPNPASACVQPQRCARLRSTQAFRAPRGGCRRTEASPSTKPHTPKPSWARRQHL